MTKFLGAVAGLALVLAGVVPAGAADRNLTPVRVVSGPSSELNQVNDIDVAADGTVFGSSVYWGALFAYAATAGAGASPARQVDGPKTGMSDPVLASLDPRGRVWTTLNGFSPYSIGGFAPAGDGDVAPFKTIGGSNTGLSQVTGIAFGPTGDVAVADSASDSIRVFDANGGGNTAPKRVIAGANTQLGLGATDIATDPAGNLYVLIPSEPMVLVFAAGASGNVFPTRAVLGEASGLVAPTDIDVDSGRNLYVSDASNDAIAVFGPTANGNVAPFTRLKGGSTQIVNVNGLSVAADRKVYVLDSSGTVLVFSPLVPLVVQGPVRALAVSGTRSAAKRVVTWAVPPANLNAGPLTGYRIVVKKGSRTVLTKTVGPGTRSLALLRSKLKAGSFTVRVAAVNQQGLGPIAAKSFRVR